MARVLLIRHSQSTGASEDSPLTELGREQALRLASWLAGRGIDRIVSSPYQRAIDTVLPYARNAGMQIEVDPRLAERRMARFASEPERWSAVKAAFEDYDLRFGDSETGREVTMRGSPALREALDAANALTALVAHGQMNAHLLTVIDPSFGHAGWAAMTLPDVFEVWDKEGRMSFRRVWESEGGP